MENIDEYICELEKLELHLKKSKGRVYTFQYKTEKINRIEFLKNQVNKYSEVLISEENKNLFLKFEELYNSLVITLQNFKIKEEDKEIVREVEDDYVNMAQFDINVVGKNLQIFKGSYEALEDFLVQAELLHDLLRI